MGTSASAPVFIAELYDIYAQVLRGSVNCQEASTHIQSRLKELSRERPKHYPQIGLIFPDDVPIIHLNQVYSLPDGLIHVVITLTPYLQTKTPYVLINPGETFGTLPNNPLIQ